MQKHSKALKVITTEEMIREVLAESNSLKKNEIEKAAGPLDELYLKEKIKRYVNRSFLARLVTFAIYIEIFISIIAIFFYDYIDTMAKLWLKISLVILLIIAVLGIPLIVTNNGRNATLLRIVLMLRRRQKAKEEEAARSKNAVAVQEGLSHDPQL